MEILNELGFSEAMLKKLYKLEDLEKAVKQYDVDKQIGCQLIYLNKGTEYKIVATCLDVWREDEEVPDYIDEHGCCKAPKGNIVACKHGMEIRQSSFHIRNAVIVRANN